MDNKEIKYAIIDVETTGMGIQGNRITEIAILVHDGQKVIQEYESLVNPERSIPHTITRLTGINDYMVADAPKFYEIAKEIIEITSDCIFVAHNVNFDIVYSKPENKPRKFLRKMLACLIFFHRI